MNEELTTPLLVRVTISPTSDKQIGVLWNALAKVKEEHDPMPLKVTSDSDTGETVLEGIGYLHLEVVIHNLQELGCELNVGPYQIIEKQRYAIMRVEIKTEKSKREVITKFIAYHRGEVTTIEELAENDGTFTDTHIVAEIPLNELESFPSELKAISKWAGLSYEFLEYRDVPG